jgi:hypothetical protein
MATAPEPPDAAPRPRRRGRRRLLDVLSLLLAPAAREARTKRRRLADVRA